MPDYFSGIRSTRLMIARSRLWRLPLSWLYSAVVSIRRYLYRSGVLSVEQLPVPVIVVGNLLVGGSGKTPVVLALAESLRAAGWHPGIISRGYGGRLSRTNAVHAVQPDDSAAMVGDEPLLLARRAGCPVFIGANRVAAARALLNAHRTCDVLLSDDGLQHYRLGRTVEIIVADMRMTHERYLLPAGLLRESLTRLEEVDVIVCQAGVHLPALATVPQFSMHLSAEKFYRLDAPEIRCAAEDLNTLPLHAVAGIGVPQRFFQQLAGMGLNCITHAFPDHHQYVLADLDFAQGVILTTEKDAVKLAHLTRLPVWVLPVTAQFSADFTTFILEKIHGCASA